MATENASVDEGSRARGIRNAPSALDAATALWDESAGVLRGGVGQVLGLAGDINELGARYLTPKLPRSLRTALERAPAMPTTDEVLDMLPPATTDDMSASRQHSIRMGELLGRYAPLPNAAYEAPFRAIPKTLRTLDKIVAAEAGKQGRAAQRGVFLIPTTPDEKAAQKLAEEYERLNVEPQEIHALTGLHRAEDGKWRVELDDSKAKYRAPDIIQKRHLADPDMARQDFLIEASQVRDFLDRGMTVSQIEREYRLMGKTLTPEVVKTAQKRTVEDLGQHIDQIYENVKARSYRAPMRLEDVIDHPELFSRVPELRDLEVTIKDTGKYGGWYEPGQPGRIALSKNLNDPRSDGRDVLLHEIQHGIQHKYGLDPGISPETIKESHAAQTEYHQQWIDELRKAGGEINNEVADYHQRALDDMGPMNDQIALDQYMANMGEKESRVVTDRMNMSQADRRKSFPRSISSATYDPGRSVSQLTFGQQAPGKGYSMSNAPAAEDAGDMAYHAGDLGYGLDTTLGRMTGGRGTGHFGTGTYFTGSKEALGSRAVDRPVSQVDLSGYNLARPKSANDAKYLHNGLRDVNDLVGRGGLDTPKTQEQIRKAAFDIWISILPRGKTPQDIEKIIPEVLQKASLMLNESAHRSKYVESASTMLMKRLGYEGVDTRGIKGFDNGDYGTVVYGEKFAPGLKDKVGEPKPEPKPEPKLKPMSMASAKPPSRGAGAASEIMKKAAESAGVKPPVTANKDLTTLEDFRQSVLDRVNKSKADIEDSIESMPFKYDKGQRVFTGGSANKNKPPYEILFRTRVGGEIIREPGSLKAVKDPETGKSMRKPYEPGYRVRMGDKNSDNWSEFDIRESAIKGFVD